MADAPDGGHCVFVPFDTPSNSDIFEIRFCSFFGCSITSIEQLTAKWVAAFVVLLENDGRLRGTKASQCHTRR
jgi:hypothetical protein